MSTKFSSGVVGAAGTNDTCAYELINTSTTKAAYVRAVTATLKAATATQLGLGRPTAIGITPTSPVALGSENGLETGVAKTAVAWGTSPTAPGAYLRRGAAPAAIGNKIEFLFDKPGLRLAPLATLVLWNLAASSQCDITAEVEQETSAVANS